MKNFEVGKEYQVIKNEYKNISFKVKGLSEKYGLKQIVIDISERIGSNFRKVETTMFVFEDEKGQWTRVYNKVIGA